MNIKSILQDNNFNFKKKFGQNFLVDDNILNNIVNLVQLNEKSLVIEIGVGAAALTRKTAAKAGFVLGYEIDESLSNPLKTILNDYENIKIIYDDFLKRNIKEDIKIYEYESLNVVANLPYYITTPIITKFIEENIAVDNIIVMVQNEVADRFSAKPGSKDYNSLTIFLNYYFDIKKAFFVSRNVFYPKPNVDSAIVMFKRKKDKLYLLDEKHFFKLVKDAFNQKRKTLKNNLKNYDLDKLNDILLSINKDLNYRAEQLTIEEFALISNEMTKQ